VQISAGKFLACLDFFWNQVCIPIIDYLPKSQTINTGYYLFIAGAIEEHFEGKTTLEVHQGCLVLA